MNNSEWDLSPFILYRNSMSNPVLTSFLCIIHYGTFELLRFFSSIFRIDFSHVKMTCDALVGNAKVLSNGPVAVCLQFFFSFCSQAICFGMLSNFHRVLLFSPFHSHNNEQWLTVNSIICVGLNLAIFTWKLLSFFYS